MVDLTSNQAEISWAINFLSDFMIFLTKKKAYSPRKEAYPPEKEAHSPQTKVYSPRNTTCSRKKEAYPPNKVFYLVKISEKCANGRYFRADTPLPGADAPHLQVNKPRSRANLSYFGANTPHFSQDLSFPDVKISHINSKMQENICNIKNVLKEINEEEFIMNKKTKTEIGVRLKVIREKFGLLKADFASKVGVARSTCSRGEKWECILPMEAMQELTESFNVSLNWLLLGQGEMFLNNAAA